MVWLRDRQGRTYLSHQAFKVPFHLCKSYWTGETLLIQVMPQPPDCSLGGEERVRVFERLEFKRVSGGIEEEHGGLFPGPSGEADIGLDDEWDPGGSKFIGQRVPILPRKNHPEVRNGDPVAVNRIMGLGWLWLARF